MTKPRRPVFLLRLRPLPRVDGITALRRGLKYLLRQCALQCLEVKGETQRRKQMPRTARQVIAEQNKQAERDRAQQPPAQSVTVAKPTLPATPDQRTAHQRYLDDIAPSGIAGRLIKFSKEGQFVFADTSEIVAESDDFVALVNETLVSYIKFNDGAPPTRIGGLHYQGFVLPPEEELGDTDQRNWPIGLSGKPENPWKHEMLLVLRRPATLELATFATMSKTGRRSVGSLMRHYDRLQISNPGAFPVVRLKPGKYLDSRYGWVPVPTFVPVGVAGGHSPEVPDTSLKTQMNDNRVRPRRRLAEPARRPGKRRRHHRRLRRLPAGPQLHFHPLPRTVARQRRRRAARQGSRHRCRWRCKRNSRQCMARSAPQR